MARHRCTRQYDPGAYVPDINPNAIKRDIAETKRLEEIRRKRLEDFRKNRGKWRN
ncbi:MAG: hypothetical protein SAJ12_03750 [Jaaginema sp. PMC 1079.18]|nr:hypothetical protein [Jaaginema sp. PMC 1080.18]MEC4850103.1 hypothetical protein [Jaaginema sp. PMC 1079.18]MEC4864809.1 hypothetical protein [Jaaginema sp. PMC 1078.18]